MRNANLFSGRTPADSSDVAGRRSRVDSAGLVVRWFRAPLKSGLTVSVVVGPACLLPAQTPPDLVEPNRVFNAQGKTAWERQLSRGQIWETETGHGFSSAAQSFNVALGANLGLPILGGRNSHHMALASLSYGNMVSAVVGEGRWFRGNWEVRGEIFGGTEFSPETEWLVGVAPHLRYHLATGTRWIPFADIGAGLTATSIGPPDLSGTFEFNLQGGVGLQWFLRENVAFVVEARFLHLSCAGISSPNLGVNGVTGMFGLTFFF